MRKIVFVIAILFLIPVCSGAGEDKELKQAYVYHTNYPGSTGNYTWLVSDMQYLNSTYSNIFELFTAQDEFGLPNVTHGSETYKTWIIRITNESSGFNKPEVLFIGGHHGDEKVGVEIAYYLAEWLVTRYETDEWIRYLIDNREIYIMPVVNPYGWVHHQRYDENGYDMNRDYPYDPSSYIFATIGARAVHELSKRHLFINTVSWHGGAQMIIYAWGCYAHLSNTECPDDIAFYEQGKHMSQYGGSYAGSYPWGRANDLLYPCYGAYEDYAYAMSWDLPNAHPSWPTNGCRSLTHCIEVSSSKYPSQSTLGSREGVYSPGSSYDGYIPKNIRIALLLTDIAEPYIKITSAPVSANASENITIKWKVMGALNTTETDIRYGLDPNPITNYTYSTSIRSGGTGWDNVEYQENITLPSQPGTYYFVIRAKVDHIMLNQSNPDPNVPPQSFYVNMRTNDSWNITNYGNSLQGRSNWFSRVFTIQVLPLETAFNFSLLNGWNLFTIPVLANLTAKSLIENISGCNVVVRWDPINQSYKIYTAGMPEQYNFALIPGNGYFVGLNNQANYSITGMPISSVEVNLSIGWNMIGWFKDSTNAKSLMQNITSCNIVCKWDAINQKYKVYVSGMPDSYNFAINRGDGVFVSVTQPSTWHGEG